MAVDECLMLAALERPVLRAYRWTEPAVSIGYAEAMGPVAERYAGSGRELVRRWTGGGVVEHGRDMTYTLVLPKGSGPGLDNSVAVYGWCHGAIGAVLRAMGIAAVVADAGGQVPGAPCFVAPVKFDVLVAGQKVAGAGQRRTARGLLHQGSLQGVAAARGVVERLAGLLAAVVEPMPVALVPDAADVERAVAERYGNAAWTFRR